MEERICRTHQVRLVIKCKNMEILILVLLFQSLTRAQKPQILRFQVNNVETYSTEEWVEFKGKIPHMNSFTACHWERLRFFSVRDSCPWAFCYKTKNIESDHHCTQLWYNRDAVSGGRYIIASGGFGDNSNGGNLNIVDHICFISPFRYSHENFQTPCLESNLLDLSKSNWNEQDVSQWSITRLLHN